jgi:hypothetical protein
MSGERRKAITAAATEPFNQLAASALTAIGSGIGAALLSGAWATTLAGVAAGALLVLIYVLVRSGSWQADEMDENRFRSARDEDSDRRRVAQHERRVRRMVAGALGSPRDPDAARVAEQSLLEMSRQHITLGRREPVELLVVDETDDPDDPVMVHPAGRHDQAVLHNAAALSEWLSALRDDFVHSAPFRVGSRTLRLIASSESQLDHFDRGEIERGATHMQSLMGAHRAMGLGAAEEAS